MTGTDNEQARCNAPNLVPIRPLLYVPSFRVEGLATASHSCRYHPCREALAMLMVSSH